ncbi:hypothetical protein BDD43_1664 [Mucilaginibacter gracilis]|uniref:GLPGLI family protein n=1 Tax=Mucilaginibacter gracilis TaxID=423350 RepID=A0A495IXT9_9SPHI|nr:hypothetical protein [Mucilaginibacter gracilis]RKR81517.1 hypothetical protein BDD43_1664 [Mucilaginibacter gracilis]
MKRLILVCFWFFVSHSAFGQVNKIDTGGDTGYNYSSAFLDGKTLILKSLKKAIYKTYYRFWRTGQIIEIWSEDNIGYCGAITNYIYKYGRGHGGRIIFRKIEIDSSDAAKVISQFVNKSINEIPSQDKLPGWTKGMDGETITIEYSTPDTYSAKSYWEPEEQKSLEGVAINQFYTQLKFILDLQKKYKTFKSELPFGKYTIGMVNMTKYGNRMRAKGGTSLFN